MIKLRSLITEAHEVVDLRDPNWVPDSYEAKDKDRSMINIHNGKIYIYRWGPGNTLEWDKVISGVGAHNDMMSLTPGGSLILPNRVGGDSKWEGARNLYTPGTKEWTEILLNAGVINPDTKVYIGNWAGSRGSFIGRAKQIVKLDLTKLPARMVFYHGTDSTRLEQIKTEGLGPMAREKRIWKSDALKNHPEWREHAVYLTADRGQANYYAKKAVAVMRRAGNKDVKKVILKVTIPRKAYRQLLPDDDYLMRQLIWIGVNWIDSLKNFSQVAYLGKIPPEWIEVEEIVPDANWTWPDQEIKETLKQPLLKRLYHGTFNALIPQIEKEGLVPGNKGDMHNFADIEEGVYLANTPDQASGFVESSENENIPSEWFDEIVVITIDTSKLDPKKFDIDPNIVWYKNEVPSTFIYRGIIPPSAFVEIKDHTY